MRAVFVDADEALASITEKLRHSGDPSLSIHRDVKVKADQLPDVLGDAEIAIIDHTPLQTSIAVRCRGLKHVVFLGTGARSYMNPEQLANHGIAVHIPKTLSSTVNAELRSEASRFCGPNRLDHRPSAALSPTADASVHARRADPRLGERQEGRAAHAASKVSGEDAARQPAAIDCATRLIRFDEQAEHLVTPRR